MNPSTDILYLKREGMETLPYNVNLCVFINRFFGPSGTPVPTSQNLFLKVFGILKPFLQKGFKRGLGRSPN